MNMCVRDRKLNPTYSYIYMCCIWVGKEHNEDRNVNDHRQAYTESRTPNICYERNKGYFTLSQQSSAKESIRNIFSARNSRTIQHKHGSTHTYWPLMSAVRAVLSVWCAYAMHYTYAVCSIQWWLALSALNLDSAFIVLVQPQHARRVWIRLHATFLMAISAMKLTRKYDDNKFHSTLHWAVLLSREMLPNPCAYFDLE